MLVNRVKVLGEDSIQLRVGMESMIDADAVKIIKLRERIADLEAELRD